MPDNLNSQQPESLNQAPSSPINEPIQSKGMSMDEFRSNKALTLPLWVAFYTLVISGLLIPLVDYLMRKLLNVPPDVIDFRITILVGIIILIETIIFITCLTITFTRYYRISKSKKTQ